MSKSQRERADEIFNQALEAPPEERTTLVERACGGEEGLRREVQSLLMAAADMDEDFLATPVLPVHKSSPLTGLDAGDRVGPYRLVEELGRGGMGRVFKAVRDDAEFEQEVALKVLKRGLDTDEIVGRFLHERQILARLHHPNIAGLMDGGTTSDGLPYFVMERVPGVPVHLYCDEHRLSVRRRLGLFLKVCDAVQFAHRNLVVHRDLKPGNILVSEDGEPKLLDFGIAKLLESDEESFTAAGMRPMTPEYASPEQILGQPITTACDVYSLGGLLYELLSGRHPFPPSKRKGEALLQWICHGEPEAPSRALHRTGEERDITVLSVARDTEPRALRRRLAGDLDAIVLKALAKDPQERYGSVQAMAEDIRRHLAGRPVEARHWTLGYQVGRFLRRHALGVGVGVLLVIVGVAIAVYRDRAAEERQESRVMLQLVHSLIPEPTPKFSQQELTESQILRRVESSIQETLGDYPAVKASLINTLGYFYLKDLQFDEAEKNLKESVQLRRETPGILPEDLARSLASLAKLRKERYQSREAADLLEEAMALVGRGDPILRAAIQHNLAAAYDDLGEFVEAEAQYRAALRIRLQYFGEEDPEVAWIRNNLGYNQKRQKRLDNAEELYRLNLEPHRMLNPALAKPVAMSKLNLAALLRDEGNLEQAAELLMQAVPMYEQEFGSGHHWTANAQHSLGLVLRWQGNLDEAEDLYRTALATYEERDVNPLDVPDVLRNLASLLLERGQVSESENSIRRALQIYGEIFPTGAWSMAFSESVLGGCLLAQGRLDEAAPLIENGYRLILDKKGKDSPYTREAWSRVERLRQAQQDL